MKKTIEEFLNKEVYDYSLHVIQERSLPSVIDGFKPSQRKIIYTARKVGNNFMKTTAFAGYVSAIGGYERGDQQLPDTIIRMVQNFAGGNNIPFLDGEGSFGSRFIPDGAAAPRYTKTKLSKNFNEIFKTDFDILNYTEQGTEGTYEPDYYVPAIPAILLNGAKGIAVGYACEFQPFSSQSLVKATLARLKNRISTYRPSARIQPYYAGYKGKIEWSKEDQKWYMFGRITVYPFKKNSYLEISEIPVGISREKYVEILELLVENDTIKNYEDLCNKEGFKFIINWTKLQIEKLESKDLFKVFKLRKSLNYNMNCISENGKLLRFYTPEELIDYFVQFRLKFLSKRKTHQINILTEDATLIREKISFISNVNSGAIELKFKSRADMKKKLAQYSYKYLDKLIEMVVHSITEENIKKLKADLVDIDSMLEYYRNVTEKQLYLSDLKDIK